MTSDLLIRCLRAVAEDLQFRGIRTFAVHCAGDTVAVEGGYQSPPAAMPVTLHYCPKDVDELIRKAQERGDHLSSRTSFIYTAEILPAVAAYVIAKEGELLSVSNAASSGFEHVVDVAYETRHGDHIDERLSDAEVYALCVRAHKRKQRERITQSRFTRFSSLSETNTGR